MACKTRLRQRWVSGLIGLISAVVLCGAAGGAAARDLTVFAAASMKTALDEVVVAFEAQADTQVTVVYAGTSVLARQIQHGAPADVFIAANAAWMDALADTGVIAPATRRALLANTLVVIAPKATAAPLDVAAGAQVWLDALTQNAASQGRIAMALVDAVPAGIYGKSALQSLGVWRAVSPLVAQTDNARMALALVANGAAPLGIVYATDAGSEPRVSVVATLDPALHAPIVYPVAQIAGRDSPHARAFSQFLSEPPAQDIFTAHGFIVVDKAPAQGPTSQEDAG